MTKISPILVKIIPSDFGFFVTICIQETGCVYILMLTDSKATQKFYESSTRTVYKHQAHQGPTLSLMAMKLVLNNAVVV